MATKLVRFLLFLSSYFPLFLIFCFLHLGKNLWVALSFLCLGLLGLFGLLSFFNFMREKVQPENIKLITVKSREDESMGYIVSYIIPFLSISTSQWQQQMALAIFFLMIAILYVNSNMIHINPMLSLFKYRIYEITLSSGTPHTLISRQRLIANQTIVVVKIGDNIFVEGK